MALIIVMVYESISDNVQETSGNKSPSWFLKNLEYYHQMVWTFERCLWFVVWNHHLKGIGQTDVKSSQKKRIKNKTAKQLTVSYRIKNKTALKQPTSLPCHGAVSGGTVSLLVPKGAVAAKRRHQLRLTWERRVWRHVVKMTTTLRQKKRNPRACLSNYSCFFLSFS